MSIEPSGILPIDKPAGKTSHDIVGMVRRLYHTRRVGHTGTLDPMATGVLVVLVGRAAKAAEYLSGDRKTYEAVLRLGITTDTEDTTGTVLTSSTLLPAPDEVCRVARDFIGSYLQTPPMYSALKVGGQKLVDLARRGIEVERKPREMTIYALDCTPLENGDYALRVTCSAGTYIRTLCADIGARLGCGGAMAALRRTETGGIPLASCYTVEALEAKGDEERVAALIPTEELFADLARLCLPAFYEKLCRSGCEIYLKKLGIEHAPGTRVRLCSAEGKFFALGEVREYENGNAVKAIKTFDIGE